MHISLSGPQVIDGIPNQDIAKMAGWAIKNHRRWNPGTKIPYEDQVQIALEGALRFSQDDPEPQDMEWRWELMRAMARALGLAETQNRFRKGSQRRHLGVDLVDDLPEEAQVVWEDDSYLNIIDALRTLTPKQQEVALLATSGYTAHEIAPRVGVSPTTVPGIMDTIRQRLRGIPAGKPGRPRK